MMAWTIFYNPVSLPTDSQLWLILPLSVSVAIVYKTLRTHNLRRLPLEVLALVAYLIVGTAGLAAGLWFVQAYCL